MTDSERLKEAREYRAVRELRRIELCGGQLSAGVAEWLRDHIGQFDDLRVMDSDEGISPRVRGGAYIKGPEADRKYDDLRGAERLRALESAWESPGDGWEDPARDWIEEDGHASAILKDLQGVGGGGDYALVWAHLFRAHKPSVDEDGDRQDAAAVLSLLRVLPETTIRRVIENVTEWMVRWRQIVATIPDWSLTWLRLWPHAVVSTNAYYGPEDAGSLSVLLQGSEDEDPDAYNTPVAHLIGVFLQACPTMPTEAPGPFGSGTPLRRVREAIEACDGQALLMSRHRLLEHLPYFLAADAEWASASLLDPLRVESPELRALWRAVARRVLRQPVLALIGQDVVRQATNDNLGSRAQKALVFSLMAEFLNASHEHRVAEVTAADLQQVLRLVSDEVRCHAAATTVQFLKEVRGPAGVPVTLFQSTVGLLLETVWPQDRTLLSPGVSGAFAELPAAAGDSFVAAVDAVRRFLVPFNCYSMRDFGFDLDEATGSSESSMVDDDAKARALLELLDLTVGTSSDAVVPTDLAQAIERIGDLQPALRTSPGFRRLRAAARR